MDLHFSEIAKKLGICNSSVRVYMARPEFAHIRLYRGVYCGIEENDLKKLKAIYRDRSWRRQR